MRTMIASKKSLTLLGCAILISFLLALPSCQSGNMPWSKRGPAPVAEMDPVSSAPAVGLMPATDLRFKDVPLPMNLKEDPVRTFVYESASLQVGRMVYTTRASVTDIASFYLREAPSSQWTLEKAFEFSEGKTLFFKKPGKRMEVTAQNLGIAQGRRLTITYMPEEGSAMGGGL